MFNLTTLLLQIAVILLASRLVGKVFRHFHQPQVMGEMMAGIFLGPSLLGWLAPGVFNAIFPPESFDFINALGQVGLVFFMFLVGLELNPGILRKYGYRLVAISNVSILVPFTLGVILAVFLDPLLARPGVPFLAFALFCGAAMSITAFPVLARILSDHHLMNTPWELSPSPAPPWTTSAAGASWRGCSADHRQSRWIDYPARADAGPHPGLPGCHALRHPALCPLSGRRLIRQNAISQDRLAIILLLMLASSLATQWIGIHPLFGAFLAGAVLPRHAGFTKTLLDKLYDPVVVLLLPMFFVYSGLRTSIGLLNEGWMWAACAAIILVAIAGKFGGSTIAARLTGMSWREAGALGVLMNTRGLIELVLLNIGL